jgi:hypothetical protein
MRKSPVKGQRRSVAKVKTNKSVSTEMNYREQGLRVLARMIAKVHLNKIQPRSKSGRERSKGV